MTEYTTRKKLKDVEHALNIYAESALVLPTAMLYNEAVLKQYAEDIERCHVYLIGIMPAMEWVGSVQENGSIVSSYRIANEVKQVVAEIPDGCTLKIEDGFTVAVDAEGRERTHTIEQLMRAFSEKWNIGFEVQYVGQSFGKDGERDAVERLLSHKTLQKILATAVPSDLLPEN